MESKRNCEQTLLEEMKEFLSEELGPASMECLQDPGHQAEYLELRGNGIEAEDAVLHLVHRQALSNPTLADEFLGHFLESMLLVGRLSLNEGLRRYLDTGDLVNSVVGSLWRDLSTVRFTTRNEFLSYLGQRLSWKASDKQRGLAAGKRRNDLRVDLDSFAIGLAENGPKGPPSLAQSREDLERLAAVLPRLDERDRELLRRRLRGDSAQEVADTLGISLDAERKAVARAVEKLRRFL
jgi:RNA polymerase sigma factor (sigma-70 family)